MVKEGTGKIFMMGKRGSTRYLTIPADVAKDDRFPFNDGEEVRVFIEKNRVVVDKIE